jgi:hypothetical protein
MLLSWKKFADFGKKGIDIISPYFEVLQNLELHLWFRYLGEHLKEDQSKYDFIVLEPISV